jgi:two-component system chemotaxis response regulator CheB
VLNESPGFEVVGFAANGLHALTQDALHQPDVIIMDIEMPVMNGLEAVRELRRRGSAAKIIMCSVLTNHGAHSTVHALMIGANDYVTKTPAPLTSAELGRELSKKIKQFFPKPQKAVVRGATVDSGLSPLSRLTSCAQRVIPPDRHTKPRQILAIGVSTGGPTALLKLLPRLDASFPVPVVIVQHMPPVFTGQLAARLDSECSLEVVEATEGMAVKTGRIIVAPGDFHMILRQTTSGVVVSLGQGERENSCRPSVDVLFHSVAEVYGDRCVALILTGMGQDGLRGAAELKRRGSYIMVQDKESSVVWGMPGAVAEAGLADVILSLDEVANALSRQVAQR